MFMKPPSTLTSPNKETSIQEKFYLTDVLTSRLLNNLCQHDAFSYDLVSAKRPAKLSGIFFT